MFLSSFLQCPFMVVIGRCACMYLQILPNALPPWSLCVLLNTCSDKQGTTLMYLMPSLFMCTSHCNPSSLTSFRNKSQVQFSLHFPLSSHILLISTRLGLCMIARTLSGLYWHLHVENLGVLSIWTILDISKRRRESVRRGGGAVLSEPLENRQSGRGQSTGIDILSVRGSVQGRFWGTAVYLGEGMLEKLNGGQDLKENA